MKNPLTALALAVALQLVLPAHAGSSPPEDRTIVFVCLHGSVKSQMAAAYFNKIARERGLPYTAVSRGIAVDASIPASIRNGLNAEGLAPADDVPRQLTTTEAGNATKIIAFDSVPDENRGLAEVSYWSDVPPATRNYAAARDAIARHIDDLVPALASAAGRSRQAVRGAVAATDEASGRIALRLANDDSEDFRIEAFKVQDGLIFNAVRHGDQVEVTVQSIDGARTIVALKKE